MRAVDYVVQANLDLILSDVWIPLEVALLRPVTRSPGYTKHTVLHVIAGLLIGHPRREVPEPADRRLQTRRMS